MVVGESIFINENRYEDIGVQKIVISDQSQGLLETSKALDSFIVDIENLSPQTIKNNKSANSRISVKSQRSLSRKASQRERTKTSLPSNGDTNELSTATLKGGYRETDTSITSTMASMGTKDTITINSRKYSKLRTSFIDPKRVLLFFATLSSMGTMVLIYLTLSISKFSGDTD